MKKVLLLITVFFVSGMITSCKKDYSCECVTTYTDGNGDPVTITKTESMNAKMKLSQASESCMVTEEQMNHVNDDLNTEPTGMYEDLLSTCSVK